MNEKLDLYSLGATCRQKQKASGCLFRPWLLTPSLKRCREESCALAEVNIQQAEVFASHTLNRDAECLEIASLASFQFGEGAFNGEGTNKSNKSTKEGNLLS